MPGRVEKRFGFGLRSKDELIVIFIFTRLLFHDLVSLARSASKSYKVDSFSLWSIIDILLPRVFADGFGYGGEL